MPLPAWFVSGILAGSLSFPEPGAEPQLPEGCRKPFVTAPLVRTIVENWDTWTVEELQAFWPDALDSQDIPPTEHHLVRQYASFAQGGACGEIFLFTSAVRGNPQYLDSLELRVVAESLDDAELAGKEFLRSFGKPFLLLSEGYDEWRLDETGWMRRDYQWDEPEMSVAIEVQRRQEEGFFLSVRYHRATTLDRPAPSRPNEPLKVHLSTGKAEHVAPTRITCVANEVDADELRRAAELIRLVEPELASMKGWFLIVPREEADYVVVLGAHWDEDDQVESVRCVSADVDLTNQLLGVAISEGQPNWQRLRTMESAARALAEAIAERFQEQYYRLLNQRTEETW
jgi:hypothetical protein